MNFPFSDPSSPCFYSKSPEDFAAFIAEDAKLWARLVKDSGAKPE